MKNSVALIALGLLLFSALACSSVIDRVSGGLGMSKVGELWSDVPKMDSMKQSDMDMPLAMKLIIKTMMGNLGKGNGESGDFSNASVDWAVLSTAQTASDVRAFYTNERMTAAGKWEAEKASTCIDGKDKGVDGVICIFKKQEGAKQTALMIMAAPEEKTKQTNVFFVRLEGEKNSAPAKK